MTAASVIANYRRAVEGTYASGEATEHSYRPHLQTLIEELGGPGTQAINEPRQDVWGAPDFVVRSAGDPVGHIECKDIGADLDRIQDEPQLRRYRSGLPNLILTDYLDFRVYADGEPVDAVRIARMDPRSRRATADPAAVARFPSLFGSFLTARGPRTADARTLAERMAAKATVLRHCIERIMLSDGSGGPLTPMFEAYREVLISDLSPEAFADLQAQTVAYGLFAARCLHREDAGPFGRRTAVFADTTPFLRDMFERIAGTRIDPRIKWIVDDLADLLARADMGAILEDFGRRSRREDPVVHFYEDFLFKYDPGLRETRGVYYTPEPVVSYIVRSIDGILRTRFSLADGLAHAGRPGSRQVLILDPAVGTGTFLREVIVRIRETIRDQDTFGIWPNYVAENLLPRLHGFELLMAPYAICHLKLALELGDGGPTFAMPPDRRLGVYLTNTLQEAHDAPVPLLAREIAEESAAADALKREQPVMVVLGNPPYSGHSANKGPWIRNLLHGLDGEESVADYFEVDGRPLEERNPKWLNDDYVKFIRFAQWRIERTGEGVLGFVTNHSYLDNPTFRGMRASLIEAFDEIRILDLHGNAKRGERSPDGGNDENVFDIQQGVAIGLFIKNAQGSAAAARVYHADLWGARETGDGGGKYGWLAGNDITTTEWAELNPRPPFYFLVPRDETLEREYEEGWSITDILPVNSVGIVTARDKLTVAWTREELQHRVEDFTSRPVEDARARHALGNDAADWKVELAQEDLRAHPDPSAYVKPILYRLFDERLTWYSGRVRGFICRPRTKVMRHMLTGPNVALITCRQQSQVGVGWGLCHVTRTMIEACAISNKTREINYLFPLYTYPDDGAPPMARAREPNLDPAFTARLADALGLDFIPDGTGDMESAFGPEDAFHYIYAVLHSPEYRRRYADFLKSDFPRIPITSDRTLFGALAGQGRRLAELHLIEADAPDRPSFPEQGSNTVGKIRYAPPSGAAQGRVWINDRQFFGGVPPETWNFTIGGYRPAEKWLKDRRGRTLAFADIGHYRAICAALAETRRIMADIDRTIDAHGGWPITVGGA